MKHNNKSITVKLIAALLLFILTETTMAFFFSKNLDSKEFSELINDLPEGEISERQIKRVVLENQELPEQTLENLHFKSCKWDSVDAHKKTFKNIIFEDCEFTNVNMRNAILINVQFLKSNLQNVVMNKATLTQVEFRKSKLISTDSNIDNGYNGIQADEILFEECDLNNIGFYRGKGVFSFEKSTLYDVAGQSLSEGSALYFHNTHASIINFDRSQLNAIEIIDSTIDKRSSVGGGSIKNIRVENSKLELSLGTNSNIETAIFENSGDVVVGGGKNNKLFIIKNCPQDTYWLDAGGEGFDSIEIENCHVTDLSFSSTSGKKVSIKNSSTYVLDFRGSKIEHLILENVKVIQKIKYDDAYVQHLESNNITFGKKIKVWKEDTNIEIKPDKILEE